MTTGPTTAGNNRLPGTGNRSADGTPAGRPTVSSRGNGPGTATSPPGRTARLRHRSTAAHRRRSPPRHRSPHRHRSNRLGGNHRSTGGPVASRAHSPPRRRADRPPRHSRIRDSRAPKGDSYRTGPHPDNHRTPRKEGLPRGSLQRLPPVHRAALPLGNPRRRSPPRSAVRRGRVRTPRRSGPAARSNLPASHRAVRNTRGIPTRRCGNRLWTTREHRVTPRADHPPALPRHHRATPGHLRPAGAPTTFRPGRPRRREHRRALRPHSLPARGSPPTAPVRHRPSTSPP
ncbi:hypothetical protein SAMN04487905_109138 [Actinopolyspora xinjiangensis]|uniref:Uncharacterized protein n=1 Tax=Actinopolyspora xinjiangensis TaxID=405564 RepID=A0A1H0VQ60_9ACTN|nr:hypothetical protein SAMN04487905_109138 [Actinopolyspora xinjiangensis]